jgi:hypothetical protein
LSGPAKDNCCETVLHKQDLCTGKDATTTPFTPEGSIRGLGSKLSQ